MKTKIIFQVACLVLSFFLFAQSAAFAKDEWIQVRSKNFNLIGNASEKDIRAAAIRLEQFREVLSRVLNRANFNSPVPTTVVVFKNETAFAPFRPLKADGKTDRWVGGYFQAGEDLNYIVLPTATGGDDFNTIFHEYAHFIVDNNFGREGVPPWFNEGLAEYYQTFKIDGDRKVTLGAPQTNHLALLRQNKLIPFETFFNIDDDSMHEQSDDKVELFYAQSWALMHYLINGNGGAQQKQMYRFLDLVMKNKAAKEAFAETFQTDFATMERELKNYVAQNNFTMTSIDFKSKLTFDAELQAAPLTDAEARAYLGNLLYHSYRYAEAENVLRQSLALDASNARALLTLGLVKMRQKNYTEAKKYIEQALHTDAQNYLAHYKYAYVLSREQADDDFVISYSTEAIEKMRAALKKTIELKPDFAEAYNLYAFINLVQNRQIDEGIEFERKALALAPANQWYQIRLAELLMRKKDFPAARALADKVFETPSNKSLKDYAQSTLKSINDFERQLSEAKNKNVPTATTYLIYDMETEKPPSEEELARRREKLKLE
ncbi:MAG: tetratricopeptide repeat protein, partial [Acidobacteria bacterium]|nr:tetratricopeptide repeat protein [Acidobacteriota bacterium]